MAFASIGITHEVRECSHPPWESNPRQPVSWWDVLNFSAWNFFWCGLTLEEIQLDCLVGSMITDGDAPVFEVMKDLDDRAKTRAIDSLKHVGREFSGIGLRITSETVRELVAELEVPTHRLNFQWLLDQIKTVKDLSKKEIDGKAFFYVPAEKIKFYPKVQNPHIFGTGVGVAFPSALQDVAESGVCLALDRGSACVFHLMRVLEIGLIALGKKFNVSLAHTNWGPAIDQLESSIRNLHTDPNWKFLPDCKEQQEYFAQVASHFGVLKDAWRNYTMHARGFYTEEQAELIFMNTKSFMQKLAERVSE